MKYKHKRFSFNYYSMSGLGILVIALITIGVLVITSHHTQAITRKKIPEAAIVSQFSFSGTPEWTQGPSNTTSMALFHAAHDCFVSIELISGTVDVTATLQKSQASLISQGYTITPGTTQPLTIQTSTGQQHYSLYQYSVTTPQGASTIEGGQEFGYLQLANSYLYIQGYCDTPAELAATIPALEAYIFTPSKHT